MVGVVMVSVGLALTFAEPMDANSELAAPQEQPAASWVAAQ
jgi:hypothetical protein